MIINQLTAWSYSRFMDYQKCPALAKYKHIMKLKEPGNQAMDHGSEVHELAQQFVEKVIDKCPPPLLGFQKELVEVQAKAPLCEMEWAFNKDWNFVGWFDRDAWLRMKVDLHYFETEDTIKIIDHKTGKINVDHKLQRSLYALGALIVYPEAERIVVSHWYLDHKQDRSEEFTKDSLPSLQRAWLANIKAMMADTTFAPRPGYYCRWCHFRKQNGGPCQF